MWLGIETMIRKIGGWLILAITLAGCYGVIYYFQQQPLAAFPGDTLRREEAKWMARVLAAGYIIYALLVIFRILGKVPGVDPVFDSDMSKRHNKYVVNLLLAVLLICLTFTSGF